MKRKALYICIFILVILCAVLYFYKSSALKRVNTQKCPEDYTENDIGTTEYRDTLISWTSLFFEANPKATISDWAQAKTQLWLDNNCTVALQRSKMSGKVVDLKPWELVDYEVQNTLQGSINLPN